MDGEKINSLLDQYKLPMAAGVVGLVLLISGVASSGLLPRTFIKKTTYPQASIIYTNTKYIKVDVSGAVVNPGVYSLSIEDRIEDAIKAAGGLSSNFNSEAFTKSINLAQKVTDGMKIYIPSASESAAVVAGASTISGQSIINVNQSSSSELESLPGVGPATAQKIIEKRPYASIEELFSKKAVTRATYEKIKDKVSIF